MNKRLHFERLYRTQPCRYGRKCTRRHTCLFYHSKSEQRLFEKSNGESLVIPLTYYQHWNILLFELETLKQSLLNVIFHANEYNKATKEFLGKTKYCRYKDDPQHNRSYCTFAHTYDEKQSQNIHEKIVFRTYQNNLEYSLVKLELEWMKNHKKVLEKLQWMIKLKNDLELQQSVRYSIETMQSSTHQRKYNSCYTHFQVYHPIYSQHLIYHPRYTQLQRRPRQTQYYSCSN